MFLLGYKEFKYNIIFKYFMIKKIKRYLNICNIFVLNCIKLE